MSTTNEFGDAACTDEELEAFMATLPPDVRKRIEGYIAEAENPNWTPF